MTDLARRVAERLDTQFGVALSAEEAECAVAAFKDWLQEQRDSVAARLPQTASFKSIVGPVSYRASEIADDAIAALVSALEEGE